MSSCRWPSPRADGLHRLRGPLAGFGEGSRLERAFRDMYTGTQHVFIGEKTYTDSAQIYLGLIEDQLGL